MKKEKEIMVKANKSRRTFTIITDVAKYRTYQMSKEEFQSCLHNTQNDWRNFLRSDDYYKI
jgi:arsenate reductase-like glutaredoxin family protein